MLPRRLSGCTVAAAASEAAATSATSSAAATAQVVLTREQGKNDRLREVRSGGEGKGGQQCGSANPASQLCAKCTLHSQAPATGLLLGWPCPQLLRVILAEYPPRQPLLTAAARMRSCAPACLATNAGWPWPTLPLPPNPRQVLEARGISCLELPMVETVAGPDREQLPEVRRAGWLALHRRAG